MQQVYLEKDKNYRLAFRPSVKQNHWYVGVNCGSCSKPIYLLDDPTKGGAAGFFVGEGKITSPCDDCGHDQPYSTSDLLSFKATKNRPSFRDLWPKPTGSRRQPLNKKYRNAKVTLGIGALEQRPECANVIARCISYWTYVESELARLLSVVLKANSEPSIALYLSLRNARAKFDALDAAAQFTLKDQDYELFLALMKCKEATEKERTDLAHGIFGVSQQIKGGVVWVSTTHYTTFEANTFRANPSQAVADKFREQQFVYELGDLETIAREIEHLAEQIGFFLGYLTSDDQVWRSIRYPQLCSEPRIQKELLR